MIEVKSNLSNQWDEVVKKAAALETIQRWRGATASVDRDFGEKIPVFAIGYEGYASFDTLKEKAVEAKLAGILQVEEAMYAGGTYFSDHSAVGPASLFGFLLVS